MHTFEPTTMPSIAQEAASIESGALTGRAWRRIAIVAATVSVLMGGVTVVATQSGATAPRPFQRDRLLRFERIGCTQVEAFRKHGWVCVDR